MATLRDIRRRIASVKSTQQITRAMKLVSAAKLRKAQLRLLQARPYAKKLGEVMGHIAVRVSGEQHPLLAVSRPRKICYVVVTADRGLCGGFNNHIIHRATEEMVKWETAQISIIAVGRKAYDYFSKRDYHLLCRYIDFFNNLEFAHAETISFELTRLFQENTLDRVYLVYNEFKSAGQQQIVVEQFLPIVPLKPEHEKYPVGYLFEPSPEAILNELCPKHLNIQTWRVLLESSAAEHGARMTAMDTATENAQDMIKELTLYYNKVRQATITKELTDIVGGAEALKV